MKARITPVATRAEIAIVADLAHLIWNEHYVPIIGREQVDYMVGKYQTPEAIRQQIDEEGYRYFLILSEEMPVGYIGTAEKPGELFLSKLYLLGSQRGKGLGREAIDFLKEESRSKGLPYITLTVNKHNLSTIGAYEKMGFEKYGEVVADIGSGYVMDDYLMRLKVG